MSELTKENLDFLQQAAAEDGGLDNAIAARELALEVGGTGTTTEIKVKDENSGEVEVIEVKKAIGAVGTSGQVSVDMPNSLNDNWRVNNH